MFWNVSGITGLFIAITPGMAFCKDERSTSTIRVSFLLNEVNKESINHSSLRPLDSVSATYWAFENIPKQVVASAELNVQNCTVVDDGSYSTNPAPQYGSISYAIVELAVPAGQTCAGTKLPFNVASYTWTTSPSVSAVRRTAPNGPTDPLTDPYILFWVTKDGMSNNFNLTAQFAPRIIFAGPKGSVDITFKTTTVAVGQNIALSIQPGLAPGQTSQTWTIPPSSSTAPIAAWPAKTAGCSPANNCPTPVTLNKTSAQYYWINAGKGGSSSGTISYTYKIGSAASKPISASFKIVGPTGAETVTLDRDGPGNQPIQIQNHSALGFGSYNPLYNPGGKAGITFDASPSDSTLVNPSGYTGQVQWVQLIEVLEYDYYDGATLKQSCVLPTSGSLDEIYPYGYDDTSDPTYTSDSPSVDLPSESEFSEMKITESFKMYLQWTPLSVGGVKLTNSIPVTLGYVGWKWVGDAIVPAGGSSFVYNASKSGHAVNAYTIDATPPAWSVVYKKHCS